MPLLGSRWETDNPRFEHLRYFLVPRYKNYVIFYLPLPDGVEILHVLHAAMDLASYFDDNGTEE